MFENFIVSFLGSLVPRTSAHTEKVKTAEIERNIQEKFEKKEYLECIGAIGEYLKVSDSTAMKVLKAKCYFHLEEFVEAISASNEVLKEDPKNCDASFVLANCLYHQGNLSSSVNKYESILKAKFDQNVASQNEKAKKLMKCIQSGRDFYEKREYRKAVRTLTKGAEIDPDNRKVTAAIHSNRGMALKQLRYYKAAIDAFDEAFALNSQDKTIYEKRAICHYKLKKFVQCINDCEEAIKLGASEQMENLEMKARKKIVWIKPGGRFPLITSHFKKLSQIERVLKSPLKIGGFFDGC
jgi:tetratricopeptide (TPR) repeat protein